MSYDDLKVQVRGIYSTALVTLLDDNDVQVVNPSIDIEERFGIEPGEVEPDISVDTRNDRQGVLVTGDRGAVRKFQDFIATYLDQSIMRYRTGSHLDVEFPLPMKKMLDELRRSVIPTIENHHYYKAFGGEVSGLVDMAERLINGGKPREVVEADFMRTLLQYLPFEGSSIEVSHVKLNGLEISLGKAVLEKFEDENITYIRELSGGGEYDGLGVAKEAGDRAVTHAHTGDYYYITKYFSKNDDLKGTYININTPVEVYQESIRYVDLDVDVVVWPNGDSEVIDLDKLESMERKGVITTKLANKAKNEAKKLRSNYL